LESNPKKLNFQKLILLKSKNFNVRYSWARDGNGILLCSANGTKDIVDSPVDKKEKKTKK
jgi:hypothetical protein